MRTINVSGQEGTRNWAYGIGYFVFLAALAGTMMFGGGCHTAYTRRLEQLNNAYEHGGLPREDYMRLVHEAEKWETR